MSETGEWNPQAIAAGSRVMVKGPDQYEGLVGIVGDGDPYPADARFPNQSGYLRLRPENYYLGEMFFHHRRLVLWDGPSVPKCIRCGKWHWRGEACSNK